jgi:hypothetical protein
MAPRALLELGQCLLEQRRFHGFPLLARKRELHRSELESRLQRACQRRHGLEVAAFENDLGTRAPSRDLVRAVVYGRRLVTARASFDPGLFFRARQRFLQPGVDARRERAGVRTLLLGEERHREHVRRHVGGGARLERDHVEERLLRRRLRDGCGRDEKS